MNVWQGTGKAMGAEGGKARGAVSCATRDHVDQTERSGPADISGIYAITPLESVVWSWEQIVDSVHSVLDAGVRLVQMRQKHLSVVEYQKRALMLGALVLGAALRRSANVF